MRRFALLLPLLLAACWPFGPRQQRDPSEMLVVCVENQATGYGNIIARIELTRMDVFPGQTECREITPTGATVVLTAETTSGGAAGRLSYRTSLPSAGPGCWLWRLGSSQATQINITPCPSDLRVSRAAGDRHPGA